MSDYTKTTWQNNVTPLSETNLNHIETGIDLAHEEIDDYIIGQIYGVRW